MREEENIKKETAAEMKKLHAEAITLLENINGSVRDQKRRETINSLMSSVVKNLNDAIISELTGQTVE
jgi:hypothetical protein